MSKRPKDKVQALKDNPLYFEGNKPKDFAEIIYRLMKFDMVKYPAYPNKEKTYNSTTKRMNGNYRSRSIQDLYRLTRTYIPDINYKTVEDAFKKISFNTSSSIANYANPDFVCMGGYCYTCKRVVYQVRGLGRTEQDIRNVLEKHKSNFLIE